MPRMPKNARKQAAIDELIQQTETLMTTLTDMRSGMSVTKACEKNQIDERYVRHLLYKPLETIKHNPGMSIDILLTPAEELYCDVLELSKEKLRAVPRDIDITVETAMDAAKLTANEKFVIRMTYWQDMTQHDLSIDMHVTESRINQLYTGAIRKLRKRPIMQLLRLGQEYIKTCDEIRNNWHDETSQEIQARINTLKLNASEAAKAKNLEALKRLCLEIQDEIENIQKLPSQQAPVSGLGFPKKLTAKLEKAGIHTQSDLCFITNKIFESLDDNEIGILGEYLGKHGIKLLTAKQAEQIKKAIPDIYAPIKISDLSLPERAIRTLQRNGIQYLHNLQKLSDNELMSMRGMGEASLNAIHAELKKYEAPPALPAGDGKTESRQNQKT